MNKIFISLGSNLGDRKKTVLSAVAFLAEKCTVVKQSTIVETKPVGYTDQPDFLNCVVEVETDLDPFELLDFCKSIEKKLGREETFRNGPRIIDLDILLYGDKELNTANLIIPHPRMKEREFVMGLLRELEQ